MIKITRRATLILLGSFFLILSACQPKQKVESDDILWYKQAAENWNEALPLGNGKLGVMVFGNPETERIQLNDDSMWPGDVKEWTEPAGDKQDLEYLRKLLFEGKNEEADSLFVEKFSRKTVTRSHQTMGDLFIESNHQNISDYRRELNISKATSTVSYKTNGHLVTQEVFVSNPHKAIVIKLSSEAPEGLNAKIRLSRPNDENVPTARVSVSEDKQLIMQGEVTQRGATFDSKPFPILHGVKFQTQIKTNNEGGEILNGNDYVELKNVKTATFYIVSNSSFYFDDFEGQNIIDIEAIQNKSFEELKSEHITDYQSLYSRLTLDLGKTNSDTIPTDKRMELVKNDSIDTGLETLLFHYGRYLLISSSREGTNPANLQGLWNEHIEAPWNADYHLNINLQMNYWLADMTNLSELNNPLFNYVDKLVENGKVTAQKNFGCDGSFLPHATDLWAPTWLRAERAYWGCSVGAGGWMIQHYWNHYEYTNDMTFLKERAYPAMHEVAKFYSDWLIEDPRDGTLISVPSTSPENRFINERGNPVATCLGSAMDQQVISEVFTNYLKAAEVLNINFPFVTKVKAQQKQLRPGFVLGEDGRILEWDRPYKEHEPGHRHMSHLYGFHPGNSVTKSKSPELFDAVKKTLDYRLANGGAGTGWSRAWLINCSARLLDAEMAHEHIQMLFKKSLSINLFDLHPPFQIDGNFGYTAGVAEMLLQSHEENIIRVLPALPSAWKNGSVKGLKARGGYEVSMEWKEGKLLSVEIKALNPGVCHLLYGSEEKKKQMQAGEIWVERF